MGGIIRCRDLVFIGDVSRKYELSEGSRAFLDYVRGRADLIRRIAGNGIPAEEIAEMTDLSLDTVLRMIGSDDVAEQE